MCGKYVIKEYDDVSIYGMYTAAVGVLSKVELSGFINTWDYLVHTKDLLVRQNPESSIKTVGEIFSAK